MNKNLKALHNIYYLLNTQRKSLKDSSLFLETEKALGESRVGNEQVPFNLHDK